MKQLVLVLGALAILVYLPGAASANWSDNFDSYPTGSGLHGQGGWRGWNGDPAADALVSDLFSLSSPNSADILPTSDIVQSFSGYTTGTYDFIAYQYIPTGSTGETYFIMLNTYSEGGTQSWSVQVKCGLGLVTSEPENAVLPLITNQWVEIKVSIDLNTDTQIIYYNGQVLTAKTWSTGVSTTGQVNIAAVDLFGNSASDVFYDNLSLTEIVTTPVQPTTWGQIKDSFK